LTAVVPRMATLRPGTTMSPSPGLWQRLIAACARRCDSTTMTPLTGTTLTSTSSSRATKPDHAPVALITAWQPIDVSSPVIASRVSTPEIRLPVLVKPVTSA
jgi:hypothetical protein